MTIMEPVLIDGKWRPAAAVGSFRAVNPATGEDLPGEYPVSSRADIEETLAAGAAAAAKMAALGPGPLATFLEAFAAEIERRREEFVRTAHVETALPIEPRLRSVEFPRTLDQLRQAASACRDRSWCRATIDTRLGIRSKLGPLGGPVAVFGPNNFPFAYNSLGGGDFASALAAGNPVIAKAHPGYPSTTRLFAEAAFAVLRGSGLPAAAVQMLYHFAPDEGLRMVSHPALGASAFTGSRTAGMALKAAADRSGKPIYLEMSSANPVFILPGALEGRGPEIAVELFQSCSLAAGQMCTKPGLVILPDGGAGEAFVERIKALFESSEPGVLLGPKVLGGLREGCRRLNDAGAALVTGGRDTDGPGFRFAPTLYRLSGRRFLEDPARFQVESFGTLSLAVLVRDLSEMTAAAGGLEGQLTGSIYSDRGGRDDAAYAALEPILRRKVGRLLNDKMPTGVAVSPAMNHGGPFPATGHPGFTAVGFPGAILRFAALHGYDHVRPDRLPPELRDPNPTGTMWRFIDGDWTLADVQPT